VGGMDVVCEREKGGGSICCSDIYISVTTMNVVNVILHEFSLLCVRCYRSMNFPVLPGSDCSWNSTSPL